MNPILISYLGFMVAALILIWGVILVGRRYFWRSRSDTRLMNTWVPLKVNTVEHVENPPSHFEHDGEEDTPVDIHSRAQQNGHYSESKRKN